ncbi:MAG: hypothetical protein JEZ07_02810 [Phycisphaerae bacterium]|nr:hypothetical protein [Phycisphaerae bacterium]
MKHSKRTLRLAKVCENCLVCKQARKKQKGFSFWFVKNIDSKVCPFCKAYEKVHGHKSFEKDEK